MKKEEIIFELSNKVATKMLDTSIGAIEEVDLEHPAFSEFSITVSHASVFEVESTLEMMQKKGVKDLDNAKQQLENLKLRLDVVVRSKQIRIKASFAKKREVVLLDCLFPIGIFPRPKILSSLMENQSEYRAFQFYKITMFTLSQLDSTKYTPVVSTKFLDAPQGSKKKKKKGKKNKYTRYLVTKKYNVDSIQRRVVSKEREYTKASWSVKGFWRTYKSGKRVWIAQSTRRRRRKVLEGKENTEPTIVRINHTIS